MLTIVMLYIYCRLTSMLGVVKKSAIYFLRMLKKTSQLSHFKVPGLLAFGFFIGVSINQLGLVMENIRLDVELVKSNITYSLQSTLHELMQKLPHLKESHESSKYLVPNIVHYFWSV